ncbi:MAG: S1 family peptidase [Gammaproteobacteria bacterium]|nr:S1 family peptidase [Gammaproteobacteria bacterium]MCD8543043.1 S1 family peptidase [Gammaproteobacteria bacterium]
MKDFETVSKLKKEIEEILMSDNRVVSVGTVKEKDLDGKDTGFFSIQVGLVSEASPETINDIKQEITVFLEKNDEISAQSVESNEIQIVFTEEGEIQALGHIDIPSTDDFVSSNSGVYAERSRPLVGGISVGHYKVGAGTLGAIVSFDSSKDEAYLLSNNHVFANTNVANIGDNIIQPGVADNGKHHSDLVAKLAHFHPISFSSSPNQVDAAIAKVEGNISVQYYVKSIGKPEEIVAAKIDMAVEKSGRTTGHTFGTVLSIDETTRVKMGNNTAVFTDQIAFTSMSFPGDSGSVLFERGTKRPIGLLFAGSPSKTYGNHMTKVSEAMSKAGFFGMRFTKEKRSFSTASNHIYQINNSQNIKTALATIQKLTRRIKL